jgi:ubiquinone/menaquinone biosynthesis C-methylase UbiE
MRDKYDRFYATTLTKEHIPTIIVRGWPKNRLEAIVAQGGNGDRLLDIGCGSGHLLYQFRERFKSLIGLEFSPHRLEQAKANLEGLSFTPLIGSAEDLSAIDSNSIDQISSADTIEHIPDVYKATQEMYRVLRPNGRLIINTPNIAFIKKRFLLLVGRFPSTSQPNEGISDDILFDGGHLHYFTFRSLRLVLTNVDFTIEKECGYGPLGRIHDLWPQLLSGGVQIVARKHAPAGISLPVTANDPGVD